MNLKKHPLLLSGTTLAAGLMAANVINLFFNAWLGRVVTAEEFGIIALINTFMYIGGMFYNALSATTVHETGNIESRSSSASAAAFFSSFTRQILKINVLVAIIWALLVPFTSSFFHIANPLILYLFTPLLIFYPLVGLGRGYLQGKLFFALTGFIIFLEPLIKLISAWFLLELNLHTWIYASIYISAVLTGLIAISLSLYYKPNSKSQIKYKFPHKFFWAAFLTGVSTISFLALDMILVKHFLPPEEAGQYAFLTLLGKIIYFLGSILNVFTISLVSRETQNTNNPQTSFYWLFGGSAALCLIGILTLGVFGGFFIPLIFGGKADAVIPYSLMYVSAIALFTLGSIIVTYHLARKNYLFPFLSLGMSLLLTIGILIFNNNLTQIVYILFTVGFINITGLLIAHLYKNYSSPELIAVRSIEQNLEESV